MWAEKLAVVLVLTALTVRRCSSWLVETVATASSRSCNIHVEMTEE